MVDGRRTGLHLRRAVGAWIVLAALAIGSGASATDVGEETVSRIEARPCSGSSRGAFTTICGRNPSTSFTRSVSMATRSVAWPSASPMRRDSP